MRRNMIGGGEFGHLMTRPTTRAVVVTRPGGPEVLEVRERPLRDPGRGEVRVRVSSSGVNRADLLQRRGGYPAPPGWPKDVPGLEIAGTVEAVGDGVRDHRVGDRVMGIVGGGGYAQALLAPASNLVPVPEELDLAEAGAVPEVFMTAFDAVFLQCGAAAGETLLIHAVGSGVGTAAVQLARVAGVTTIGTSRTPEKLEKARALGLDHAVLGGERSWDEEVLDLTGGRGVDVVLGLVGAPYVERTSRVLAEGARWIVVGVTGGAEAELDLRAIMRRRASVTGTVLRSRSTEEKGLLARRFHARVGPLLRGGRVGPVVERTFAPEEAGDAHRLMEENRNFGKLLLVW